MVSGELLHLPFDGGMWDQDDMLLDLIKMARVTWYVFKYKPANKMKWDADDLEFMAQFD
jgi:hypothetical protein